MRPASAGILSATWLPMPIRSAASWMIARRSSVTSPFVVETRSPPPSRTCTSVLCVSSSVALKSCWNARLLERAVDDLVRGLAQSGGRRTREALVIAGSCFSTSACTSTFAKSSSTARFATALRIAGSSRSELDVSVKTARVQRDSVDPDGERREEQQQAGDDEHDPDGSAATAALTAAGAGARWAFALRRSSRRSEATARRARTPRAEREPPARRRPEG